MAHPKNIGIIFCADGKWSHTSPSEFFHNSYHYYFYRQLFQLKLIYLFSFDWDFSERTVSI
jgi:hypothetical protein